MIVLNEGIKFRFNPFGGLSTDELDQVIDPNIHLVKIKQLLAQEKKLVVELVGKKGRGKSTHLKLLHRSVRDSTLFNLHQKQDVLDEILKCDSSLIIIDSIHHLNLLERFKVYHLNKSIVFSTHFSRTFEFFFLKRVLMSYTMKGISTKDLNSMIIERVRLASSFEGKVQLNNQIIDQLLDQYGDDYRGILKDLYYRFDYGS